MPEQIEPHLALLSRKDIELGEDPAREIDRSQTTRRHDAGQLLETGWRFVRSKKPTKTKRRS